MPAALSVDQSLKRAQRALKNGDRREAKTVLTAVLQRFPANRRAQQALAQIDDVPVAELVAEAEWLERTRAYDSAERVWEQAFQRSGRAARAGLGLALCRLTLGRPAQALEACEAVLAARPDHAMALDTKGRALRDLGRLDGAEACHKAALGHGIIDAGPLNHLGILAQARGDRRAAAEFYRQALVLAPDKPDLHHNLSRTITYHAQEPHLANLHAQISNAEPGDTAAAPLHFAMFKALEDLGEFDAAFAHLEIGNRLRKQEFAYDVRRDAARFSFCRALLADAPVLRNPEPAAIRPIFVTGLPRSGTTLVEQILSQAPGTQAGGELAVVASAAARVLRAMQIGKHNRIDTDTLTTFRTEVLEGLRDFSDGAPVLIDKMPLNFRWIGLICAAFPEARIVHLERNPLAVAWSLYRHKFSGGGNGFAYDIADIATYLVLHRDLMSSWQQLYPGRVTTVDYGELVQSPEPAIRKIISACDLEWSDACLAPQNSTRSVLTASADQVREPIHDEADQGWRRYETQLAPLRAALRAANMLP